MNRILQQSLLAGAGLLLSATSFAHPSAEHHYGFAQGLWHLVSEPDHLLMLLAGIGLVWYVRKRQAARQKIRHADKE